MEDFNQGMCVCVCVCVCEGDTHVSMLLTGYLPNTATNFPWQFLEGKTKPCGQNAVSVALDFLVPVLSPSSPRFIFLFPLNRPLEAALSNFS